MLRNRQITAFDSREVKLEQDREQFLRNNGWRYSSSYPDHCWRWSKEIQDGRFTTGSLKEALGMEERLEATAPTLEGGEQ
jgi:hypothetical protein